MDINKKVPDWKEFCKNYSFEFGRANPEIMDKPFWHFMALRPYVSPYYVGKLYNRNRYDMRCAPKPIYTHERIGQTITKLPNGDIIKIGGEYDDYYDPDFNIYNDVVLITQDGKLTIYGYPPEVFEPTDFHTANFVPSQNVIYIIGCIGFRQSNTTPVYRLKLNDFSIERVDTTGDQPGWISHHSCILSKDEDTLTIQYGRIYTEVEGKTRCIENTKEYSLNLHTFVWKAN